MLNEKQFALNILKRTPDELLNWLPGVLKSMGYDEEHLIEDEDYIYAMSSSKYKEGRSNTLLIAYLDTPYQEVPKVITSDKGLLWSPEGIGANGRCGVYIALECIRRMPMGKKPNVLFLHHRHSDDKHRLTGMDRFTFHYTRRPKHLTNVLILNGIGSQEKVIYKPTHPDFLKALETNTELTQTRISPDIHPLGAMWGVPVAKLPTGYMLKEGGEFIVKPRFNTCMAQTHNIIKEGLLNQTFESDELKPQKLIRCSSCGMSLIENEVRLGQALCLDCYVSKEESLNVKQPYLPTHTDQY